MAKIAIVGGGVEGRASYEYFAAADPSHTIVFFDEAKQPALDLLPAHVEVVAGANALDELRRRQFDLVLRSPGLSPDKLRDVPHVSTATKEFFRRCPAPIIGVTGTKGKGTTCSLIAAILTAAGRTVHLVGNIGTPALTTLPDIRETDIVVYELSSFQLWDLEQSPHIAVLLMIEADHLDVHRDFADYVNAKAQITRYQSPEDRLVYNTRNDTSTQIAIQSVAEKVPYPHEQFAHVAQDSFWYGEQKLCSTSLLKLPGTHNLDNACAAIAATWPYVSDGDTIGRGLATFTGLPHRLKYVTEIAGVGYYDDSIATTPGSAIAAIAAFAAPKVLIVGGSDKGADFSALYDAIAGATMRHVIVIGSLADTLENGLRQKGIANITNLGMTSMHDIVATAQRIAQPGDTVIMSPACASFDMFKNYKDRGEQFVAAVTALEKGEG